MYALPQDRARTVDRPLVVVLAAACAGTLLDRVLPAPPWLWWLAAAASWGAWLGAWRLVSARASMPLLLVSVVFLAASWHHCRWSLFADDHLAWVARNEAAPTALEVRAASGSRRLPAPPPDALSTFAVPPRTIINVEVLAVRDGEHWRGASGTTRLIVNGELDDVRAGDRLRVFGQFGRLAAPANPGDVDFARLARADRRLFWLRAEFAECVTRLDRGWSLAPGDWIDWLRTRSDALLWRDLGAAHYGLGLAMFLGVPHELDPDLRQAFVETGTVDLLVVSGLHVAILASFLFGAMRVACVERRIALVLVAAVCVLYAATTDANPPVVRATVVVLLGCLAVALGRRAVGFNVLAAAALIVLIASPAELFVTGTQLSFLSVGVLAVLAEARNRRPPADPLDVLIAQTRRWPERWARRTGRWAWNVSLTTTAIWLVIAPLVMARFHLVTPAALALGPLLAVPMTLAMMSGFGLLLGGWLLPPLGTLFGWLCDASLSVIQRAIETAREAPGSHYWVGGPADWWLVGFYGALACWALVPQWRPPRRWLLALASGWIGLGLLAAMAGGQPRNQLRCTFLSVGHGTAVVLELPDGRTLLYDAGRLGSPVTAARIVAGYLWSRGIYHLDAAVLSHADADHYNALPALVEQFSIGTVYVSPVMFEHQSAALAALRAALADSGTPVVETWSGDRLDGGDVRVEVLHPPRRGVLGSDNANSIVLAVEYAGRRLLLTGDLESPGLDDLLAELPYDCDVAMAPHHGSASSNPPGFAAWSSPEWTIVSGGSADRLSAVEAAYRARGSRVLHTARAGAVSVTLSAEGVFVAGWQDE